MLDVAERAGVSRTTVSLILNGRSARIPEETKQRVRDIAAELQFRPSRAALQLRTQQSHLIGFIGDEIATGPFAGGLIAGAQAAAEEAEHALMVMNTGRVGDLSVIDLEMLADRQVDGVIFATVMTREVRLPDADADGPMVLLNCFAKNTLAHTILPDDEGGGHAAAALVLSQGHRRVAYLAGEAGTYPAIERERGFLRALRERDIPVDSGLIRYGDWTAATGYQLAREVLALPEPPTALLCGNDRMALGAYDAIREVGLRIGEDVSVIGYDDQREIAPYMNPPLTTIRMPYLEMGQLAVKALLAGRGTGNQLVECVPVERSSLGPAPGH